MSSTSLQTYSAAVNLAPKFSVSNDHQRNPLSPTPRSWREGFQSMHYLAAPTMTHGAPNLQCSSPMAMSSCEPDETAQIIMGRIQLSFKDRLLTASAKANHWKCRWITNRMAGHQDTPPIHAGYDYGPRADFFWRMDCSTSCFVRLILRPFDPAGYPERGCATRDQNPYISSIDRM